ncbi:ATP-dependent helicase HrpB [Neoactinobaculum massilliense]|uniref:ATP-dependent helicase HrpB n=1 Tax=Neoactinobaculum massilliense TaxID=2364794 RepID=UPI000F5215B0|nr:ATP-dependent helicase HrpB [Neoactinobaculum massilliense]
MTRTLDELVAAPPALPVAAGLPAVGRALPLAVVQAPPGTGKTTLIPPYVATRVSGRVIVTQPRRVAARAAARRIAALLGEPVGRTVGYAVRGDSRVGRDTRIEMVTPGVLVRRLQSDPELAGVAAVILDEVHERHLDSDLALAFTLDVVRTLRPDLAVLSMSATVDAQRFADLMGEDGAPAPIVDIPGAIHPVEVRFASPPRGAEPLGTLGRSGATGVQRAFLAHVARTVEQALAETTGDMLVFLPGVREVEAVAGAIHTDAEVLTLHGSLPAAQQDRVLSGHAGEAGHTDDVEAEPGSRRRVIVSTAIAESSLTVPGVRVVVDAGLSREPRTDYARGVGGLVTVLESQASGVQRAGRAGREGPGVAYRVMSEQTWARLRQHALPELATADLTDFLLEAAVWGAPRGRGLALVDSLDPVAVDSAVRTLRGLGLVDAVGQALPGAADFARLPLDARLAVAAVRATPLVGAGRAAEVAAALGEDIRVPGADFSRWRRFAPHGWERRVERVRKAVRAVAQAAPDANGGATSTAGGPGSGSRAAGGPSAVSRSESAAHAGRESRQSTTSSVTTRNEEAATALVMALAYPDRVARQRDGGDPAHPSRRYLLTSGMGAELPEGSPLMGAQWLAVAGMDRGQGRADALIRSALPITEADARLAAGHLERSRQEVALRDGRLSATETVELGSIPLRERPAKVTRPAAEAWLTEALVAGRLPLSWSDDAATLRSRLAFLHAHVGEPWPDVSDAGLAVRLEEIAGPELAALMRGGRWGKLGKEQLERILPWPEAAHLNELAPARIEIPTGDYRRVDYTGAHPTVRLRVQEAFGWRATPRVAGGRVPITLELLSPAQRPVAITDDLATFWRDGYLQVRAEMRGRYPRHPWPEDAAHAEPTRRAKRRK